LEHAEDREDRKVKDLLTGGRQKQNKANLLAQMSIVETPVSVLFRPKAEIE